MARNANGIHTCIMHTNEEAEIVFNQTLSLIAPIRIDCDDSRLNRWIPVENPVVYFKIPAGCQATNEYLLIDRILTARMKTFTLKGDKLKFAQYELEEIHSNHPTIRNSVTHTAIKKLIEESKKAEMIEKEKTEKHTYMHAAFSISGIAFFIGISLSIYLLVKKMCC